jgi:hypothetical protein
MIQFCCDNITTFAISVQTAAIFCPPFLTSSLRCSILPFSVTTDCFGFHTWFICLMNSYAYGTVFSCKPFNIMVLDSSHSILSVLAAFFTTLQSSLYSSSPPVLLFPVSSLFSSLPVAIQAGLFGLHAAGKILSITCGVASFNHRTLSFSSTALMASLSLWSTLSMNASAPLRY